MVHSQSDHTSDLTAEELIAASIVKAETVAEAVAEQIEQVEKALKNIYFISGLGADERVFYLLKVEGYQPVHIRWLKPERNESIADYAKRLTAQIKSDRPIIIGLSFGGIISVEIAKQIEVEKVILISSAKTASEIPLYFKLFRWFPIHRVFPFKTLLWMTYRFSYWIFSLEAPDECQLLRTILVDIDADFLKWALHKVVTWKNQTVPECLHHLHGTGDRIFPIHFVMPHATVEQGGHLMVINRATQVSSLLQEILKVI